MQLQNVDRTSMQQLLSQLDVALYNHQQWHNVLVRTIACRLPSDKHDIVEDAHKECRFGQWYYSNTTAFISEHPGFIAIGESHKHMHHQARQLLNSLETSNTISPMDYDNFANAMERLRLEISALKNEVELILYNRDPLTMAINRISMLPMLREQQELVRRRSESCCLAMLDLDFFKKVNDEYGHVAGDKVLAAIGHFLLEHVRAYDKVFRYGGEEFLLFLQNVEKKEAYEMMDRIRKDISALPINVGLPEPISLTVSLGVTVLDPDLTVEQSIDNADKAMYQAKKAGRNRTQLWEKG